jgi:hypothetical protein
MATYSGAVPWNFVVALSESRTVKANIDTFTRKELDSIWQFAVEFWVLLGGRQSEAGLTRCAGIIDAGNFNWTVIASQLLLKAALERPPLADRAVNLLYGSIFRHIGLDKLASSVRHPFPEYRITSDTEELFISFLSKTEVVHADKAFSVDVAELYRIASREPKTLSDDITYHETRHSIKWKDVRHVLRTARDQQKFDNWLSAVRDGVPFDAGRPSMQPARARPRYI